MLIHTLFAFSLDSKQSLSYLFLATEDNEGTEMSGSHDYRVVVGAFVTAVASQSIAAPNTAPLPPVDWDAVDRREEAALDKLRARAARLGVGVTPAQQALFDVLARVYRDSRWGAAGEMLIEDAVIRPPYTPNDVTGPTMLVDRIKLVCCMFLWFFPFSHFSLFHPHAHT